MNLTTIDFNSNNYLNKKNPFIKYELPFIKINIQGKKGETTHIIRKLNNSKNHINEHLDQLLFTGFNGNLEDLHKMYGINNNPQKRKSKPKKKLFNRLLLKYDLLFKPIQKTVTKEFNFVSKNKVKIINMKTLMTLMSKKDKFKHIINKNKGNIRSKSAYDINSKKIPNMKTTIDQKLLNDTYYNNFIENKKESNKKMKKINQMRKLLSIKSRNILKNDENKSTFETFRDNQEIQEKEQKPEKEEKNLANLKRINIIRAIIEKEDKKKKKNKLSESVKLKFKKLLAKENKDDKEQFKTLLDPLSLAFKGLLKEVKMNEGKDKHNIWIKKSTANLVSFGNSFQLMSDELFYKDHKRIISKYPDIEREANILVPEKKVREDNKIIEKIENNERKIRDIINENDNLLKIIRSRCLNSKHIRYSKSQSSIHPKKKIIKSK